MSLHSWKGQHWASKQRWLAEGMDLSREFHVYGLEWTPTELIWYFDGQEIRRLSHEICHRETAVLKWAGDVTHALDGTSMDVDWVRVYEQVPAPSVPTAAHAAD
ncbi:family 16 glycosylhydrolase [bacterium]|nr:family 16 glycosylhydrolase [bacterium]